MSDKNLKSPVTSEFLSEDSEDYSLDDIIQLHKVEEELKPLPKIQISAIPSGIPLKIIKGVKT